jgi:hypothetical protein
MRRVSGSPSATCGMVWLIASWSAASASGET